MADNLAVSVTADTSELRAQLALAQADLKAFGAETRKLATDIRSGGDASGVLRGQLEQVAGQFNAAKSNVVSLTGALRDGTRAHIEHATGIKAVNEALVGMTSPITGAVGGLREFAEIAGIAFVGERIIEFSKQMAELGEKTVIMAAALGLTPQAFSLLAGALTIAGGDAETAERTMERLAHSVGQALANPASAAGDAFRRLGITQDELKTHGSNLDALLTLLAARFVAYRNDLDKTNALHELAGRGMDKLIPALRGGAEGWEEIRQRAHDVGAELSGATIEALAKSASGPISSPT